MIVQEVATIQQQESLSLDQPDYWWYRARSALLEEALGPYLGQPTSLLDVGSADGPSVGWMRGAHRRFTIDVHLRGLQPGEGVCASALALPFCDGVFDVVGAFDVLEHCQPESLALREMKRVLVPGGRLLIAVPAYQWAWTDHDVAAGHYRRYTRRRLVGAIDNAGFHVERVTYAFTTVFPFFVADRVVRRLRPRNSGDPEQRLTPVPAALDRVLLGLTGVERRIMRRRDLPFGSSVFLAALKPLE